LSAHVLALTATSFWLIFVAELGDKTLFMVLLLAARYPPTRVFAGAALAFAVHAGIAVALGQLLAKLPTAVVRYGSAAVFVSFGLVMLFKKADDQPGGLLASGATRPLVASFTLIFLAEWGDATQILGAVLVANNLARLGRLQASVAVLMGSIMGLWLGTALAAIVGHRAGRWLPEGPMRKIAGVCFLAVGAYTALAR